MCQIVDLTERLWRRFQAGRNHKSPPVVRRCIPKGTVQTSIGRYRSGINTERQRHTIHSISQADTRHDEDWLIISLADEPNRQSRLTFSQIDTGLTLRVQLYSEERLSNPAAIPVLDTTVLSGGGTPDLF